MTFRTLYNYDFIITDYGECTESCESQSNKLERVCSPARSIFCVPFLVIAIIHWCNSQRDILDFIILKSILLDMLFAKINFILDPVFYIWMCV